MIAPAAEPLGGGKCRGVISLHIVPVHQDFSQNFFQEAKRQVKCQRPLCCPYEEEQRTEILK
jgi:hypothetical protein